MRVTVPNHTARNWAVAGLLTLACFSLNGMAVAWANTTDTLPDRGATATFEDTTLNLAEGWGEAQACLIWSDLDVHECYRTEREMDLRIAELEPQKMTRNTGGVAQTIETTTCSGYLKLYDGTSYVTPVLYLHDRFVWLNLSVYGFDQRTSSYRVGPCYAYFADLTNGGGSWYPTSLTQAYDQSSSMISGWNNDVSSVYIG